MLSIPLGAALQTAPFRGHIRHCRLETAPHEALADAAIVVPARNEAGRIAVCLEHCRQAMAASDADTRLIVVVNNSTDGTAGVVGKWSAEQGVAVDLIEVDLASNLAHAGGARRLALDAGRRLVHDRAAIMSTDADSRPDRDWVHANLNEVERGAALVCGRVVLDRDETACLPGAYLADWAIEESYARRGRELCALIDPDPGNLWPHHSQVSGASLTVAAWAYDRIGGAPVVPVGEDRALAACIDAFDLPIRYADAARVITSGRLDGRAPGGMAATIRSRLLDGDKLCDDRLEPALATLFRAKLRARLRAAWSAGGLVEAELLRLGLGAEQRQQAMQHRHFGAAWASIEVGCPALRRVRLVRAQLAGELRRLNRYLTRLRFWQASVTVRQPMPRDRVAAEAGELWCR